MRYGNQRVETAVVSEVSRINSKRGVLTLVEQFHRRYGERFGEGSQSPEAGIRINTIRVCSYVEQAARAFCGAAAAGGRGSTGAPRGGAVIAISWAMMRSSLLQSTWRTRWSKARLSRDRRSLRRAPRLIWWSPSGR